jgi:hypothetical protein
LKRTTRLSFSFFFPFLKRNVYVVWLFVVCWIFFFGFFFLKNAVTPGCLKETSMLVWTAGLLSLVTHVLYIQLKLMRVYDYWP